MATRLPQRKAKLYVSEWMEARGMSDEQAAKRLGNVRETIWRWRTQPHRLNPDKLASLAGLLDIEPQEFYRPPSRPSIDAMLSGQPDELQAMAADIVRRLVNKS